MRIVVKNIQYRKSGHTDNYYSAKRLFDIKILMTSNVLEKLYVLVLVTK
jgi:hypothetical protein